MVCFSITKEPKFLVTMLDNRKHLSFSYVKGTGSTVSARGIVLDSGQTETRMTLGEAFQFSLFSPYVKTVLIYVH